MKHPKLHLEVRYHNEVLLLELHSRTSYPWIVQKWGDKYGLTLCPAGLTIAREITGRPPSSTKKRRSYRKRWSAPGRNINPVVRAPQEDTRRKAHDDKHGESDRIRDVHSRLTVALVSSGFVVMSYCSKDGDWGPALCASLANRKRGSSRKGIGHNIMSHHVRTQQTQAKVARLSKRRLQGIVNPSDRTLARVLRSLAKRCRGRVTNINIFTTPQPALVLRNFSGNACRPHSIRSDKNSPHPHRHHQGSLPNQQVTAASDVAPCRAHGTAVKPYKDGTRTVLKRVKSTTGWTLHGADCSTCRRFGFFFSFLWACKRTEGAMSITYRTRHMTPGVSTPRTRT